MSKDDLFPVHPEDLPPLSYSTMETFVQCPHQYLRTKIIKDVAEDFSHPSAVWGNRFHKVMEEFLRSGVPLPEEFAQFRSYADRLNAIAGDRFVEHKMAVTHDGQPGNFFDNSVRFRAVCDLLVIRDDDAVVIDHKTGKVKLSDQLGLNALVVFAAFPHVREVKAAFTWVKYGSTTSYVYTRTEKEAAERLETLQNTARQPTIVKSVEALERDRFRPIEASRVAVATSGYWPKRPSGLCPWCPVKDCEHNKR